MSIGRDAERACRLEVMAPKAGNVHPGASFDDTTWHDFTAAAEAIAPVFDRAIERGVGETILAAVEATRRATNQNVNLGIILLFAPIAACRGEVTRSTVQRVLDDLDNDDCKKAYRAIALAKPGGLGEADEADVHGEAPDDLVAAMRLAADRDLVARQYANGFEEVFDESLPFLETALERGASIDDAIVLTHLRCMADHPDSLIARRCGDHLARESAERARRVLGVGEDYAIDPEAFAELDSWLRADGHRRNPGTSADVVAATLFLAVRAGIIP